MRINSQDGGQPEKLPTLHELLYRDVEPTDAVESNVSTVGQTEESVIEKVELSNPVNVATKPSAQASTTVQKHTDENKVLSWSHRKALLDFFNIEITC